MGTYFLIGSVVDTIFLEGCARFSELVRTGNLDFVLTKPVDEQFLLSFERIDWAEAPTAAMGLGLVTYSTVARGIEPTFELVAGYLLLVAAGVALLYSFMLMISSLSVWLVRSQWFLELWFMVMLFARYPADIYRGGILASTVRITLTFVIPVLLAINIPARFGAKYIDWPSGLLLIGVAAFLLFVSRQFFFFALSRYRSASS
jgi:ABC-2 type transport system permease protein